MRKRMIVMVLTALVAVLLLGCLPQEAGEGGVPMRAARDPLEAGSVEEYHRSIDYSCETAEDCAIKDVGNCCGAYPRCVNRDAKTFPKKVMELCSQQGLASVCGFPSISRCECQGGLCVGVQ